MWQHSASSQERATGMLPYDPAETLESYRERKASAHRAFVVALEEGRVKARLKAFYDDLVDRVGMNCYAWIRVDTLAARWNVDDATIKRWLRALVVADLIRRRRRMGHSSLTYITTYERWQEPDTGNGQVEEVYQSSYTREAPSCDEANTDNHINANTKDYRYTSSSDAFGSENAPTISAKVRRDHVKNTHSKRLVGGERVTLDIRMVNAVEERQPCLRQINSAVRNVLEKEAVADFFLVPELATRPLAELRAVSTYLDQQRNIHERSRLFAWLVSRNFGAQLLQGADRRSQKRGAPSHANPITYVSGPCAALLQEPVADLKNSTVLAPANEDFPTVPPSTAALWNDVQTLLRTQCSAADWATWIQATELLHLTDTVAVVGTANVFIRDTIRERFLPLIHEAMQVCGGTARTVEVVIGSA